MLPASYGPSTSYVDRLRGALLLDSRAYREVEQDTEATGQAGLTVVLAALATGIGAVLSRDMVRNVVGLIISSGLQWIVFSVVAYLVGSAVFATPRTSVTLGQVLRTVGFAQAPKLLLVLGIIPILGWVVGLVVFFWFLAAAIVALREAFEFDTGRAIATGIVALIGAVIVDAIFSIFLGIGSAMFGGITSMLF